MMIFLYFQMAEISKSKGKIIADLLPLRMIDLKCNA